MNATRTVALVAILTTAILLPRVASAQPVADFYNKKQVRLIIGQAVGGGYDAYARLLGAFMGSHIPGNPTLVPQNMEGASSLAAINHIYNSAPRDGSEFGMGQRALLLMPILDKEGARFDASKLSYIGSMDKDIGVCIVWRDSGFQSIEDLKTRQILVSTSGKGAELTTFYSVLRKVLGLKIKVISGYRGGADQELALERGEVQGRCGISYGSIVANKKEWIDDHKIKIVLQLGLAKHPQLPDVPLLTDLVTNEQDRQALEFLFTPLEMGRPFFAPPDIPADRLEALCSAFDQSLRDPGLLARAEKLGLSLAPVSGKTMQDLMNGLYQKPPEVIARVKALTTE